MRINRTWIEDTGDDKRAIAATKEPVQVLPSHFETLSGWRRPATWYLLHTCSWDVSSSGVHAIIVFATTPNKKTRPQQIW
jgi:hypothetical protein